LQNQVDTLEVEKNNLQTQVDALESEYQDYQSTHHYSDTQYWNYVNTHEYTNEEVSELTRLALFRFYYVAFQEQKFGVYNLLDRRRNNHKVKNGFSACHSPHVNILCFS